MLDLVARGSLWTVFAGPEKGVINSDVDTHIAHVLMQAEELFPLWLFLCVCLMSTQMAQSSSSCQEHLEHN